MLVSMRVRAGASQAGQGSGTHLYMSVLDLGVGLTELSFSTHGYSRE